MWHQGQKPPSLIRIRCSLFLTWGKVAPRVFFEARLLEAKKVAALAEVHYAQIAPHLYCGPVVGAANIQIAACSPNFLILESIQQWGGFHADILKTPIRWEDGFVIPPTSPGLGVELDEAVALANPYPTDGNLHLEMIDRPLG